MAQGPVKVVNVDDAPPRVFPGGTTVRRIITKSRVGSKRLQLGDVKFEPVKDWHDFPFTHIDEAYYVLKGSLEIQWSEEPPPFEWRDENKVVVSQGQCVFLPHGIKYRERCAGREPAVVVYAVSPPVE